MEMCVVKTTAALETTFSALLAAESAWAQTAGRRGAHSDAEKESFTIKQGAKRGSCKGSQSGSIKEVVWS